MKKPDMNQRWLMLIILLVVCYVNLFTFRGAIYPEIMEARNLVTAREMVQKDNWLNPTMNDYPRLAKPPFPTWLNAFVGEFTPVKNLAAHRLPPALITVMMILAIFGITRLLSADFRTAWMAGMIAATSLYLIIMGRQSTWDIYCHAFMTGAIYFLLRAWMTGKSVTRNHIIAGILMGLSFLSKGPVAFYAMLLPFLISWSAFMNRSIWRIYRNPLLLALVLFIIIGLSWPVYSYLTHVDLFTATMGREVSAWSERHVRPFYQYWGFWSHIGIWSVLALATFVYPRMRGRMEWRKYRFLLGWVLLTVILLSIPAEKKERYLLPVLTPLVVLVGMYAGNLYSRWRENALDRFDKFVIYFNSAAVMLAWTGLFVFMQVRDAAVPADWLVFGVILLLIAYVTFVKLRPDGIFALMIIVMSSVSLLGLPRMDKLLYRNEAHTPISALQQSKAWPLKFYAENMNPVQIWELEKPVDTIHVVQEKLILPEEKEFVLLVKRQLAEDIFSQPVEELELLDSVHYDPEKYGPVYYVYRVSVNPSSSMK